MLTEIQLKNFQSHTDSRLEFTNGINVIGGPSDSGKTAILRALDWVRLNRPRGTSIIHHGQKQAGVTVRLTKGAVQRIRSNTKNGYAVESGDSQTHYDVVGTDVPHEVTQVLDLDDLNIQKQLDPHFLLFDSPGAVAGRVFEYCNLDNGLRALDTMGNNIRKWSASVKEKSEQRDVLTAKLDSPYFVVIEDAETLANEAHGVMVDVTERTAKVERLEGVHQELLALDVMYDVLSNTIDACDPLLREAMGLEAELDKRTARLDRYEGWLYDLTEQREILSHKGDVERSGELIIDIDLLLAAMNVRDDKIDQYENWLDELLNLKNLMSNVHRFDSADDKLQEIEALSTAIASRKSELSMLLTNQRNLRVANTECSDLKESIESLEAKLAQAPTSICPTCGQEIK